jgi:hypothetical protein
MSKMSTSDLKAMLASEKANALAGITAARLTEERADAMDYYLGDMAKDMPAQDGRSRAVSTDVADTIDAIADGYARREDCKRVRIYGRKGWLHVLDGYEEKHIIVDKELS